jgi:transposase
MPTKLTFILAEDELAEIEYALTNAESEGRRRAQAILLLHQGHSVSEVARKLNIASRTTVYGYWRRFKAEGVAGLADRARSGRPQKADNDYCRHLEEVLAQQPNDLGYDQPGWTVAALRDHMQRETGITLSENRFRDLLRRLGYVFGRVPERPDPGFKWPRTVDEQRAWSESLTPWQRDVYSWHKPG